MKTIGKLFLCFLAASLLCSSARANIITWTNAAPGSWSSAFNWSPNQVPGPADTAFIPSQLQGVDAVLAMYHDQGLPVLKHHDFANAVNITLGLPFVRTSVDHGTALELAGTGRANISSLIAAIETALKMVETAVKHR